ncbi:unnamed protein product [Lactuca virosa]|uniref:Uncharacterized protein n=1 Tax=Lactuca virosa TaxID=75947 RepID=A0AAU9NEK3_9ASTR|nr:unnamed protein product [Lactuca virosa]
MPMPREVLRFKCPEPVPAHPASRNEHPEPSQPRPPVIGMPYMQVVDALCGYTNSARRTTIAGGLALILAVAIAGGLALILAVALVWVIVFWG